MKPAVATAIIGLLFVITSLLAWPYIHDSDIRNTEEYQSDVRYCDLAQIMGQLEGEPFAGAECDAMLKRKYGL
jgi:hypothetical protein